MLKSKKYLKTITSIPDDLWNEIKNILPTEKPENTIGRPIISYRKVLDGIMFVLRTGCHGKCYIKNMVLLYMSYRVSRMDSIRIFL